MSHMSSHKWGLIVLKGEFLSNKNNCGKIEEKYEILISKYFSKNYQGN